MELNNVYTQIITQNSRAKHNLRSVPNATHKLEGVNPTCGDELILELRVKDGLIEDAGFTGHGCAIFMASSSMMIDNILGQRMEDADTLIKAFFKMINQEELTEKEEDSLDEVMALQGVAVMPSRVKCATLSWHTLEEELKESV